MSDTTTVNSPVSKLSILIVTQYFWPEKFQINHLAEQLREIGHEVTILTGKPNYPSGKIFDGYKISGFLQEDFNEIKVLRVPLLPRGNSSGIRLALNYFSFFVAASFYVKFFLKGKFDIVFTYEPSPITVGIPAVVASKKFKAKHLFWVQDLWPESLQAAGGISSRFIIGCVRYLVRYIYDNCDKILIQSEAFRHNIAQITDPKKIRYYPQSVPKFFKPVTKNKTSREELLVPDGFKIMFAGNIGDAQDFETILSAAELIKSNTDIHWVILGDGRKREWLQKQILKRGLTSCFHLLGSYGEDRMPKFFACADAMLVSLKDESIFALTIPTKIQAYMACGKPIIANLNGEGARIVTEAGAGYCSAAGNPKELAKAVERMYAHPLSSLKKMGNNAYKYSLKNFDQTMLLGVLNDLMFESLGN